MIRQRQTTLVSRLDDESKATFYKIAGAAELDPQVVAYDVRWLVEQLGERVLGRRNQA